MAFVSPFFERHCPWKLGFGNPLLSMYSDLLCASERSCRSELARGVFQHSSNARESWLRCSASLPPAQPTLTTDWQSAGSCSSLRLSERLGFADIESGIARWLQMRFDCQYLKKPSLDLISVHGPFSIWVLFAAIEFEIWPRAYLFDQATK